MRCDEIQEGLIDLLYDDTGDSQSSRELREHLRTCSNCRKEFQELKSTRQCLQLWKDESPLRDFSWAGRESFKPRRLFWRPLRYAAVAAMLLISLLALANTQISLNKDGFFFSTKLLPGHRAEKDYYTKAELRSIVKSALDDSENRTVEINNKIMQEVLDLEQEMDMRFVQASSKRTKTNF
jgi:hypothetical protein